MTELPGGWTSGPLSDFVTPRGEKAAPADFPELPFIGMDHVEPHTTRIVGSVPSGQMKSRASRFYEDDVLYGRLRPYLNKVAQPRFDGLASGEFIVFEGNELIDAGFLRYRLQARDFVNFASHLNEGDRPRVNFAQIGTFEVLVPPREEQRRIVERIEHLFDEIDRGAENLRDGKRAIEPYRQSLLKSAFEGRLTADWRAANPDKTESTDTLLACARKQQPDCLDAEPSAYGGIPSQWLSLSLSSLGQVGGGLTKNQKRHDLPLRTKYLRVANVYANRLVLDDVREIGVTAPELEKTRLEHGDLLFVEGNGSIKQIGRVAVWNDSIPNMTHQNHLIRFRSNGLLSPRFALYFMMSPVGRRSIVAQASSTSGLHTLSISKVEALPVPICSPAEQAEVVRILDVRLETAEALDNEIDANLASAEALRQSILKRAFSGELVPQNPDDDPAQALLARIRASRDGNASTKPRRPGRRRARAATQS